METELLKHLDEINKSIEELTMCFVDGFGGTTIHQTLEEIKVVNNDINDQLKRIADALERQVANQVMINNKIMGNINDTH
jgi:uncharacterized coiled-coil DUF342 family protein